MPRKLPQHLLLDSEASLRLADNLLADLRERDEVQDAPGLALVQRPEPGGVAELPEILLRACAEINNVLDSLRMSRVILERTTVDRVQQTQSKLVEVSQATELATNDMLDGLDQALGFIDGLDAHAAGAGSADDAAAMRAQLRDRLHGLVVCLQFQDITSQQLTFASTVLADVESRMNALAELIDRNLVGLEDVTADQPGMQVRPDGSQTFDPAASTQNAHTRQAIADAIFISQN
jgi:hypothetical protein